ncbi:CdaR family transcriptional regulator [Neobacillus mesonae]|uniref:PucR family transcriptional regulator n=1 Tax=Neobacillus mesonae TaxID=1193713 RepID=UPI0020421803|nr:helix-turn-helix domain-containing protein [Neobacillus mesonae]MCM3568437.1 helix-turn-helix domain-containing protein [Neobacillus mesonae]
MLKKLLSHYKGSVTFTEKPDDFPEQYYLFCNEEENEWIGLMKSTVSDQEFKLLKSLFTYVENEPAFNTSPSRQWYEFLYSGGPIPVQKGKSELRFILFHIHQNEMNRSEIEAALTGFFSDKVPITWMSPNEGVVIEERSHTFLTEEELISMSATLEGDFYVKVSFYVGKFYPYSEQLPILFKQEKEFFAFALEHVSDINIFTYERIFPFYTAYHLPDKLKHKINEDILEMFREDPDLFSTVKIFLENNLNSSVAAKKLFIHRNTLQYRIDKFTEKIGLSLKDFYGAFTVFLACLVYEYQSK